MSKTLRQRAAEAHAIWRIEYEAKLAKEAAEERAEQEAEEAARRALKALSKAERRELERKEGEAQIAKDCEDFTELIREIAGELKFTITGEGDELEAVIDGLKFVPDFEARDVLDVDIVGTCLVLICPTCNEEYLTAEMYGLPQVHEQLEHAEKRGECVGCWQKKYIAERKARRLARKQQKIAKDVQLNA